MYVGPFPVNRTEMSNDNSTLAEDLLHYHATCQKADHHNTLGNIHLSQKKYEEAQKEYEKAIELLPRQAAYHNNYGNALSRQAQYIKAQSEFETAISLNPDDPGYYYNLANVFFKQSKLPQALTEYEKAVNLNPNVPIYHYSLGNVYYMQKKYLEAGSAYEKSISLNPEHSEFHYRCGKAYLMQEKNVAALGAFEKAVELKSDHSDCYTILLRLYFKQAHAAGNKEIVNATKLEIAALARLQAKPNKTRQESCILAIAAYQAKRKAQEVYQLLVNTNPTFFSRANPQNALLEKNRVIGSPFGVDYVNTYQF